MHRLFLCNHTKSKKFDKKSLTKCRTCVIIRTWYRKEVLPVKKMGRPKVENPKDYRLGVRIDAETKERLQTYCKENNVPYGEAVRRAINLLIGKEEKK